MEVEKFLVKGHSDNFDLRGHNFLLFSVLIIFCFFNCLGFWNHPTVEHPTVSQPKVLNILNRMNESYQRVMRKS